MPTPLACWPGKVPPGGCWGSFVAACRAGKLATIGITRFAVEQLGDITQVELPKEGDVEQWEIINLTADAHPIHFHLVQAQLMNRQAFDTKAYNAAYAATFPGGGYDHPLGGERARGSTGSA